MKRRFVTGNFVCLDILVYVYRHTSLLLPTSSFWGRHIPVLGVTADRGQLKCDGTRAETRFRHSAKRTSPFKSAGGRQFSRLLAVELCASALVMLDTSCSEVVWRVLATHCIRQFPLHFPSYASPCAITFQPTGLQQMLCSGQHYMFRTPLPKLVQILNHSSQITFILKVALDRLPF